MLLQPFTGHTQKSYVWLWFMVASPSLLLTWINFNTTMDNNYIHYKVWDEITYPFLNFNGATVEV